MAEVERMTVIFPEPMAARIREAVAQGDYTSTSEVVRDAVRLWSEKRESRELDLEILRKAFDEGKASGIGGEWNMDEIIREAGIVLSDKTGSNG